MTLTKAELADMIAYLSGGQVVGGSNPLVPTKFPCPFSSFEFLISR